jgi:hypothetical protein
VSSAGGSEEGAGFRHPALHVLTGLTSESLKDLSGPRSAV